MNVDVTETATCRRKVEITIEPDQIEENVKEKVREYRKTKPLKGFRPGRVPERVIRSRFGKEIREDVLRRLHYEGLLKALEDNDLELLSDPSLEESGGEGNAVVFSGEIDVKPQVEITDYKDLSEQRELRKTTDEQIDRQVEMVRERHADEVPVERPVQANDVVVVSMAEVDPTGVPILGEEERERRWQVGGMGSPGDQFDEQLTGMIAGGSTVVVVDDEDTQRHMKVTLKEIYERQLPELDEEFLKDLGDFEKVEDLKDTIRSEMESQAEAEANHVLRHKLMDQVVDTNEFDVPEPLVERHLQSIVERQKQQDPDADDEAIKAEHRDEAMKSVRAALIVERIAKQEDLVVSDERLSERVARMALGYRIPPDQFYGYLQQSGRLESIRSDLLEDVVLEFLQENAKIKDVEKNDDAQDS